MRFIGVWGPTIAVLWCFGGMICMHTAAAAAAPYARIDHRRRAGRRAIFHRPTTTQEHLKERHMAQLSVAGGNRAMSCPQPVVTVITPV